MGQMQPMGGQLIFLPHQLHTTAPRRTSGRSRAADSLNGQQLRNALTLSTATMTKEYTLDEIRRLADTNPEKLAQEYQASRAATANLVDRARAGIAARSANPPTNKFNAWAQGYGNRFIYNGSIKPLAQHDAHRGRRRLRRRVVVPPQYVGHVDQL
ncbi:hypothetical protein ON010_g11559 [Phytophthora cinnamomi]|nr:hypothetical protein ON010_g11559 [Phytophthora cinnamomi]